MSGYGFLSDDADMHSYGLHHFDDEARHTGDARPRCGGIRRRAGGRSVPRMGGITHSFRYLAAGDCWFNDESSGDQDGPNCRLHT